MQQPPNNAASHAETNHATIEIQKEYLHFSAAHFTIFSATERENLHGHNFQVEAILDGEIGDDGLCFDYNEIKNRLKTLCNELDEKVLLPEQSPYLTITHDEDYVVATFGIERIPFLPRDVSTLPLRNITVEELAHWFISCIVGDTSFNELPIDSLTIRVASGPGQWASSSWAR
jgi:6-pyruvoyltetrahydropterin/6-carboxytetrahydropterin synthase